MSDFLLEIGTEEIPARFIAPAKEGLATLLKDSLNAARISFGEVEDTGHAEDGWLPLSAMSPKGRATLSR